jgi:alkanesulfonate monooxygenase SsuD/methylene tetrahydromethanopterin reductase-like flavin-dependent oxidoreductase (luciferase family)
MRQRSVDRVMDALVTYGTPDEAADKLLAFRENVGDFGMLLYAGHDWLDRDLGRQSMMLVAEKVLPRIEGLGPRISEVRHGVQHSL